LTPPRGELIEVFVDNFTCARDVAVAHAAADVVGLQRSVEINLAFAASVDYVHVRAVASLAPRIDEDPKPPGYNARHLVKR
jgi:hypothetical protein